MPKYSGTRRRYAKKKYTRRRRYSARRSSYRTYRRPYSRSYNSSARKLGALYKSLKMKSVFKPSKFVAVKSKQRRASSKARSPVKKARGPPKWGSRTWEKQKDAITKQARINLERSGIKPSVAKAAAVAAVEDVVMGDIKGEGGGMVIEDYHEPDPSGILARIKEEANAMRSMIELMGQ